jgi:hypothetical protein
MDWRNATLAGSAAIESSSSEVAMLQPGSACASGCTLDPTFGGTGPRPWLCDTGVAGRFEKRRELKQSPRMGPFLCIEPPVAAVQRLVGQFD